MQSSKLDSPSVYQKPATTVAWCCVLSLKQFAKQFINLLYKCNKVNSPEAWIINETFRYEDSMRKTATTNICIAFSKKSVTMTNVILIPKKAIHFNTSWSIILAFFSISFPPDPFRMASEKPLFTFSPFKKKNLVENVKYYSEKGPCSPYHGKWPRRHTVHYRDSTSHERWVLQWISATIH